VSPRIAVGWHERIKALAHDLEILHDIHHRSATGKLSLAMGNPRPLVVQRGCYADLTPAPPRDMAGTK
jgi:hypothetical protein